MIREKEKKVMRSAFWVTLARRRFVDRLQWPALAAAEANKASRGICTPIQGVGSVGICTFSPAGSVKAAGCRRTVLCVNLARARKILRKDIVPANTSNNRTGRSSHGGTVDRGLEARRLVSDEIMADEPKQR